MSDPPTPDDPRTALIALGPGEGRRYPCGTMQAEFKADGAETGDSYSVSEWTLEPGSSSPGAHSHEANDDVFYVLEGTATFVLDDVTVPAGPGTFVRVPIGITHDYRNDGDVPVRLLNLYVPGGFEADMPGIVDWFRLNK